MESIINIEDRLRAIKAIFELSIEAKAFPDEIRIYTIYQKWDVSSNFRSESLSLSLNDPRHKKTVDIIYRLSNDIIALFDQLKKYLGELGAGQKYRMDCKPAGNGLGQLYLLRWRLESEDREEFQFIDGEWWPYKRISNDDKSDFVCTSPLFLIDFVMQTHQFLKDRIFVEKPKFYPILPLPKCFIDKKIWEGLLLDPRLQDCYEKIDNETYRWTREKNLLSGLAFRLLHKQKLIDSIKSGQDLAKIFCPYFGIEYDLKDDRSFRPDRAMINRFDWID